MAKSSKPRSSRAKPDPAGVSPLPELESAAGLPQPAELARVEGLEIDPPAASASVARAALRAPAADAATSYTVVARRYRPTRFAEVVGQDHVVRALSNAIRLNRIAQAYLFSGTRGVGKTSIARIFAKCLNCVRGPTIDPCLECDACVAIARGQDVDVIEIDGASNNGVEQVRELRQNASLRPSRSRFKIYYIDEVHMLSTAAFNALLKTLEEPPPHVKFLFATTEPNRIPVTVLSRCQRYDFAGITPDMIAASLEEVCRKEGIAATNEALVAVARRAGGSMRDAQSLLESLLSSGAEELSLELVQSILGTASDEHLLELAEALIGHQPGHALALFAQALAAGVQPGDLLGGLIDVVRDAMVTALGSESLVLSIPARLRPRLKALAAQSSVDTIMAILQILAEHRMRLKGVAHTALVAEIALVKAARIERLEALGPLVDRLEALALDGSTSWTPPQSPQPPPSSPRREPVPERPVSRTPEPRPDPQPEPEPRPAPASSPARPASRDREKPLEARLPVRESTAVALAEPPRTAARIDDHEPEAEPEAEPVSIAGGDRSEIELIRERWAEIIKKVGPRGWGLRQVEPARIESDTLVLVPRQGYNDLSWWSNDLKTKAEAVTSKLIDRPIRLACEAGTAAPSPSGQASRAERTAAVAADPFVQKFVELFEARLVQLDFLDDDQPASGESRG